MNELIFADRELEVDFIGKLDALLEGIENLVANSRPTLGGERFLTDRGCRHG